MELEVFVEGSVIIVVDVLIEFLVEYVLLVKEENIVEFLMDDVFFIMFM